MPPIFFVFLSSMIRKAIKFENISRKCPFNDACFLSSPLKWVTVEVAQLSKAYFYPKTLWKARKLHESFGCYCRQFMWHSLESVRFTDFIMIWTNHFQQQQTFLISHPCFLMVWTKGGMIMLGVIPQPPNHPILPKKLQMLFQKPLTLDCIRHSLKKVWLFLFCGLRTITFKSFSSLVDSKISTLIHVVMQPSSLLFLAS